MKPGDKATFKPISKFFAEVTGIVVCKVTSPFGAIGYNVLTNDKGWVSRVWLADYTPELIEAYVEPSASVKPVATATDLPKEDLIFGYTFAQILRKQQRKA